MGFIWWALPSLLSLQGVDLATITKLSATLTLPWVFKFIMGPVIDFAVFRKIKIRHFIVSCQIMMGILLLLLIPIDWVNDFQLLVIFLFIHGCFAATQDVSIDALAIRTTPKQELGQINGWMQTGMLLGRALTASIVLAIIGKGYQTIGILLVITMIWLPMVALLFLSPSENQSENLSHKKITKLHWKNFITPTILIGLWLALTASAGFEFFSVSVGPFMQKLGNTEENLSLLFGVIAPIGLVIGALTGGRFTTKKNSKTAILIGITLVAATVSLMALLTLSNINLSPKEWLLLSIPIYIAIGFLTCASYTLFMELSNGKFAATRFSIFMSATNGCEVWVTYLGSRMISQMGHPMTMLLLLPISLLALPALLLLKRKETKEN